MLPSAADSLPVKPLVYLERIPVSRSELRGSFNKYTISLKVFIPAPHPDGAGVIIYSDRATRAGLGDGAVFAVIQKMVEWIDDHLDQDLSVATIANKSGYSVWHFQRKFVQLTGLNVYEYVRIRRVINATFLLVRSRKRILEVAIENGFNCQASFTRTTREVTGFTPAVIRKKFGDNEPQWIAMIESLIHSQMDK